MRGAEALNPFRHGLALGVLCQQDLRVGGEKALDKHCTAAVCHRAKQHPQPVISAQINYVILNLH